ncbi:MAG: GNAT family N-acetyltransferase [Pikeienuella sp.]
MTSSAKAGDEVDVIITYLEMAKPPTFSHPPAPSLPGLSLIRAEDPPARWFRHLYDSVGADYEWTDWHERSDDQVRAFITDPAVSMHVVMLQGWTAGFFMLDARKTAVCDLAYFGLAPEARGRGIGTWLLKTAILTAWELPGVTSMTLNTCSLDSPRALPLYQRMGFEPVSQETVVRTLSQDA